MTLPNVHTTTLAIAFCNHFQTLQFFLVVIGVVMTTAYHTPSSAATANSSNRQQRDSRMDELLDEMDHKRCTDANQKALLHETLDQLRELTKTVQQDDWIFQKTMGMSTATRMR